MSRAEAGRLGGRAKASARKASASVRPQPSTSAPSVLQQLLGPSSVSLGPHASQSALVPRDDFLRESWLIKSTALQSWISSPVDAPSGGKPLDHTNNLQLVLGANAKKSAKEGAKQLKVHRRTVASRRRVLALCVVLFKRFHRLRNIESLHNQLVSKYGDKNVRGLLYVLKYKYDEMSLTLNIDEQQTDATLSTVTALAKLLVVTVTVSVLWKVNDSYIVHTTPLPTTIRALHKTSGRCMNHGLALQLPDSLWGQSLFEQGVRLPIADQHGANELADEAFAQADKFLSLDKHNCHVHKIARVGNITTRPFDNEKKGVLYGALALQFGGTMSDFKAALKAYIRKGLDFFMESDGEGPGAEADLHREAVYRQYLDPPEGFAEAAESEMVFVHRTRRLWNGRLRKGRPEHWCKGPDICHTSRDHFLEDADEWVDSILGPKPWRSGSWKGATGPTKFFGLFIEVHRFVLVGFCKGVCGIEVSEDDLGVDEGVSFEEMLARVIEEEHLEELGENPEEDRGDLELPEPAREDDTQKRQSTYRTACRMWLGHKPRGKLWALKTLLDVQQHALNKLLGAQGEQHAHDTLKDHIDGNPKSLNVLRAFRGEFTLEFMHQWGQLMVFEAPWVGMPAEFQTHTLAVSTYCAAAAGIAAMEELMHSDFESQFFMYELLSTDDSSKQEPAAQLLLKRFTDDPCLIAPAWVSHVRLHPTVASLTGADSVAKVRLRGTLVDLDNTSVECHNAGVRRNVKSAVQEKRVHLQDVSMQWTARGEVQERTSPWGWDPHDEEVLDAIVTMQGGGGGRCRAFVSKLAPTHRLPSGRTDFGTIMKKYREECEKESSPLLEECALAGEHARLAGRAKFSQAGKTGTGLFSNFGTVRQAAMHKFQETRRLEALLPPSAELESSLSRATNCEALVAVAAPQEGHLVPFAESTLSQQIDAIRHARRQLASQRAERDKADRARVIEGLKQPLRTDDANLSLVELPLAEGHKFRAHSSGKEATLRIADNAAVFAAKQVEVMRRRAIDMPVQIPDIELQWRKEHRLIKEEDTPELGPIDAKYKRGFCFTFGKTVCLCKGHGVLLKWACQRLGSFLARACPAKSKSRKQLMASKVLLEVRGVFWHLALMYLRPQRPTVFKMRRGDEAYGRPTVVPELSSDGLPRPLRVVDMVREWDLESTLAMRLYVFVGFDNIQRPWIPSRRLTYEPLETALDGSGDGIMFWKGDSAERDDELEKERRKRLEAERRQARAAAGAAPKPRRKRRAKRSKPDSVPKARKRRKPSAAVSVPIENGNDIADAERDSKRVASTSNGESSDHAEFWESMGNPAASGSEDGNAAEPWIWRSTSPGATDRDCEAASIGDFGSDRETKLENADVAPEILLLDFDSDPDHKDVAEKPSKHPEDDVPLSSLAGQAPAQPQGAPKGADAASSDDLFGDADDEGPQGPESDSDSDSSSSDSSSGSTEGNDGKERHKNTLDLSKSHAPTDCTLRRYEPEVERPYWQGMLPPGIVDHLGRHSRRRAFGTNLRTELEAQGDVEGWLYLHAPGDHDLSD